MKNSCKNVRASGLQQKNFESISIFCFVKKITEKRPASTNDSHHDDIQVFIVLLLHTNYYDFIFQKYVESGFIVRYIFLQYKILKFSGK